jgi:hypothetical protein
MVKKIEYLIEGKADGKHNGSCAVRYHEGIQGHGNKSQCILHVGTKR